MKKRILALLFAGLLTASLTSCFGSGGTVTGQGGTQQTSAPVVTTQNAQSETYTDVDETVYTIAKTSLTEVNNSANKVTVNKITKLRRTGYGTSNSIVEYENVRYYIANSKLTTADLLGEQFEAIAEVTMYATENVNVRTYASSVDTYSPKVKTLSKGDAVVAVAKSEKWIKIKSVDADGQPCNYFVSAEYLSTDPQHVVSKDFEQFFTDCAVQEVKYIANADSLNVRQRPSTDEDSTILISLAKGTPVTVCKQGTGDYASWVYVKYPNTPRQGVAQTYDYGYLKSSYLASEKESGQMSLDELLVKYPQFSKETKVLYSTGNVNVRTAPDTTKDDNKVYPGLIRAQEVNVVASGVVSGAKWYIFCYTETQFCFVSASVLTTSKDGENAPMTLDELLLQYNDFTKLGTAKPMYATAKVNGFSTLEKDPSKDINLKESISFEPGSSVKVVASGTRYGAQWYIIEHNDSTSGNPVCHFVGAEFFSETKSVG